MIYLVRHGETQFNAEKRFQGSIDLPLSQTGVQQAEFVANRLAPLVDAEWAIYSSPLRRAKQTAEVIAAALGRDLQSIIIDHRLREVSLGDWEGLTPDEIVKRWPQVVPFRVRRAWSGGCPNGETFESAAERLSEWLGEVGTSNRICVCHGIVGSILRGIFANLTLDEMLELPLAHEQVFRLNNGGVEQA
jgi:broad specificity phosphatase PhoE